MAISKINKFIKDECANYNYDGDMCFPRDMRCCFFTDTEGCPRCSYFEKSVLPFNANLEYEYRSEHKLDTAHAAKTQVRCQRCNTIIDANSNRQKYCDKCKKAIQKEQKRNWAKNQGRLER